MPGVGEGAGTRRAGVPWSGALAFDEVGVLVGWPVGLTNRRRLLQQRRRVVWVEVDGVNPSGGKISNHEQQI